MSRLIDADALKEDIIELLEIEWGYEGIREDVSRIIDSMPATEERPHGECGTCKHFVKGGLDGKTYVCEHPSIDQDDYYNYAFLTMDENDFCSCYEKKEGETE